MEIKKILDILDVGSKILNIEQIIIATKHNKNYEKVHNILKECKTDLTEEIIKIYNNKSYKYGVLERDKNTDTEIILKNMADVFKTFEEKLKKSPVSKAPIRKTTKK